MTFARANPAGWALFELLTSAQMNVIDENLSYALDGRDGGTYAPTNGIVIDGDNLGSDISLQLLGGNDAAVPALDLLLNNGSARGIRIRNQTTVNAPMLQVTGTTVATSAFAAASFSADYVTGASGGRGVEAAGGGTGFTGGTAGEGTYSVGGTGAVANSTGGHGTVSLGGSSNFTGTAGVRQGGSGVNATGGSIQGNDLDLQWGGYGGRFVGGVVTGGNGKGGVGVFGWGGSGTGSLPENAGWGVLGRGSFGVRGVLASVDPFSFATEFDDTVRAGVYAAGMTYGRSLMAEFSGLTPEVDSARVQLVGAGTGITTKTVMGIRSTFSTPAPSGRITGLAVSDTSAVPGVQFGSFTGVSKGAPGMDISITTSNLEVAPHIRMSPSFDPLTNVFRSGGLSALATGAITGLLDTALFVGHGTTSQTVDRLVSSGDRAVAQAWARISTDGSGNVTLGTHYGVLSVAIDIVLGETVIEVTLDTLTGGPADTDMVAFANMNSLGYAASARVENATTVWLMSRSPATGTYVDFTTQATDMHFVLFGKPDHISIADRPTYYRP